MRYDFRGSADLILEIGLSVPFLLQRGGTMFLWGFLLGSYEVDEFLLRMNPQFLDT